jgi:hypothetical protein
MVRVAVWDVVGQEWNGCEALQLTCRARAVLEFAAQRQSHF